MDTSAKNTPLLSKDNQVLAYSTTPPPTLLPHVLQKAAPQGASGPWGDFLFQRIATPEAVVWYNNYLMKEAGRYRNTGNSPRLELQFSLNNSFTYRGEALGERLLRDGSYNLLYVPEVNREVELKPERLYTTFEIYLTPIVLERMLPYFSILKDFIDKVAKREATTLCPINQITTTPMSTIIGDIMDNHYEGSTHEFYVSNKVVELLLVTLERITYHPTVREVSFREQEIQLIYEAKDELLRNLDKNITAMVLSRTVGLNVSKIKSGFHEFYGCSVAVYLEHCRMKEARAQLTKTSTPVKEVGFNTGYPNPQHFSKAYKKYFGHTPARLRKDFEGMSVGVEGIRMGNEE